jgi:hypothetical protein
MCTPMFSMQLILFCPNSWTYSTRCMGDARSHYKLFFLLLRHLINGLTFFYYARITNIHYSKKIITPQLLINNSLYDSEVQRLPRWCPIFFRKTEHDWPARYLRFPWPVHSTFWCNVSVLYTPLYSWYHMFGAEC